MDIKQVKESLRKVIDMTYPGLEKPTKDFFYNNLKKQYGYTFKDETDIPDFINAIMKAESIVKESGVPVKTSIAEFFLNSENVEELQKRVRNTVYKVQENPKKDWFLSELKKRNLLDYSVEAVVLQYEGIFTEDIINKCKENLKGL
jgi:hypothetical protein